MPGAVLVMGVPSGMQAVACRREEKRRNSKAGKHSQAVWSGASPVFCGKFNYNKKIV